MVDKVRSPMLISRAGLMAKEKFGISIDDNMPMVIALVEYPHS